ncbi:flippase [candidate division KSB1 bacterium]|nr:flippase [candidate division KSB1 bacterium]
MKQLYKNIGYTGLHQLIVTALAFILVPVATRYLGAHDYGVYTVATTIGFFVSLFADLGISTILTREISKRPKIAAKFFARVLSIKLLLTVLAVCALLIYLALANYTEKQSHVILIFSIAAVLGSFSTSAFGVFRGIEKMEYEAIGVSLDKFISVIVGIAILLCGLGVEYFIWSFVASGVVLFIFSFWALYRKFIHFEIKWHRRQAKIILFISIYLGISAFLSMIYNYMDILMLSKMGSMQDVGFYSAAHRVLMVTRIFPTILVTAFLPQLSAHHADYQKLANFFSEGVSYLFLIIFPLVPATVLLADPIIQFICGVDFMPAADALQILAFATAAQILNIFFVPLYIATNNEKKIVHFQLIGLYVNVVLNLILIPVISFKGAAIATVATEAAIFIFIYAWIRRKIGARLFPALIFCVKALFSTLIMMMVVFFTHAAHFHILFVVVAGLVTYTIILEVTNTLKFSRLFHLVRMKFTERGAAR